MFLVRFYSERVCFLFFARNVLTAIVGQSIYYFIFGVLGACRQAPYKFKKSYGGGFVWELPIVITLRTGKPTIFY
jgi:hypothetical protein